MNGKDALVSIINDFNVKKFENFFRMKHDAFTFPDEDVMLDYKNRERFSTGKLIAQGSLNDKTNFMVCSFKVNHELTERSSKKAQFEIGKGILKKEQADAGIFIFYDQHGSFRFSLIYVTYPSKKREFSTYKRFTYYVSKEQTYKTFLQQVGEADFSSLEKIIEAFNVEPLTKQFYNEVQNWYFWAMDKISFPEDYKYNDDPEKDRELRDAANLIRLITRIIFVWFLKQRDLVPARLFSREDMAKVVKNFCADPKASNYYNAILQNLFFATLNKKMSERAFANEGSFQENREHYMVKTRYRYRDKFTSEYTEKEILDLFKDIPFLNGGLFDCLDKEYEEGNAINIDGFSRNAKKQAKIPDYLFFQEEEEKVDLSSYGIGANRPVRGLLEILSTYNFTIDENTPVDQEVALDPELLGKVFENLLACYNPETSTTARKATGSYYTPREIVDYMVETSLVEYLKEKTSINEETIKNVLAYKDEELNLQDDERIEMIRAIDTIKILDPACGSGAFPMGVLHKLVYALEKLDPKNEYWRTLQYQKALRESEEVFKQDDKNQREERLKEINETFDEGVNYPDYARKLYLIENCIYGVDIQPIAIQISKLRFFISLVLEQKIDRKKENFNIRPLPNLETKFVAANTLISLEKPDYFLSYPGAVQKLENSIKELRHKYFQAKTRQEKLAYQKKDKELRKQLASELKDLGFGIYSSEKIAAFDPYDQNAHAEWFDPELMFGVKDGFDIVIANPPYIQLQKDGGKLAKMFKNQNYKTFAPTGDIYTLFYERGLQLLKDNGILCYITSNKWMRAGYGEGLRKFFQIYNPKILIDLGPGIFESATVDTNILIIQKKQTNQKELKAVTLQKQNNYPVNIGAQLKERGITLNNLTKDSWFVGSNDEQKLKEKIEHMGKPLKEWDVNIYYGIKTGLNEAFIIDSQKREEILANCNDEAERKRTEAIIKPILRGRDIKRYYYEWAGLWVIVAKFNFYKEAYLYPSVVNHLSKYEKELKNRGQCRYTRNEKPKNFDYKGQHHWLELDNNPHDNYLAEFEKEKVVWTPVNSQYSFTIIPPGYYFNNSIFMITNCNIKLWCAIFNSKLVRIYFTYLFSSEENYTYASKESVEKVPLPPVTQSNQPIVQQIEALVDKIISAKKENFHADTSEWEREIDRLVYGLYELTEDEIKVIENK